MKKALRRVIFILGHCEVFMANKRFKRDSQRVAFLLCVGFGDYGVVRKLSSSVGCPLSGRYKPLNIIVP